MPSTIRMADLTECAPPAADRSVRSGLAFRFLCGGALTVLAVAVVAVGLSIWNDRQSAIANGVLESRNVVVVLAGRIERSVQAIDSSLRELQRRIAESDRDALFPLDSPRFHALLSLELKSLPESFHIAVADARGNYVASTARWPAPRLNNFQRAYFQELATHDDERLAISLPVKSLLRGKPAIVFARRLSGPDRSFLGIVFVTVSVDYFGGLFDAIEALPGQAFTLLRRNGVIILRHPSTRYAAGERLPSDDAAGSLIAAGGGAFRGSWRADGAVRWFAVQPLAGYDLVVMTCVPEAVLLRDWRTKAVLTAAGTVALLACALVLLAIMARQVRRIGASEASLAEKTQALEQEHALFNAALDNMSEGLAMLDRDARLLVCNSRFRQIHHMSVEQTAAGCTLRELLEYRRMCRGWNADVDQELATIRACVSTGKRYDYEIADIDGRILLAKNNPVPGGGWVVTFDDITDQRASEARIRQLANHDLLTGIANRPRFLERIAEAREQLWRDGRPFNVMMLDLDHFKTINDSLGHPAGDGLLREVARRLDLSLRESDVLARLGGDEFAILQTPPRNLDAGGVSSTMRESAVALATRIVEAVREPCDVNGHRMVVSASIGIAMAPDDGREPEELMKRADLALYRAKSEGRNGYAFFEPEMAETARERQRLEADMRVGLAGEQFELHYQPLVDVATRRPCGMEALVRWRHPDRGLIPPDRFIALAEDTGLITALGEWVLETACREAVKWPPHVKVAVNISPVQFRRTNLLDVILCALLDSRLPPERLEIEITERVLLANDGEYLSTLHQLRNLGVKIALDDFGTGYSSLSYLTMFPFDKIKIDQSFTRQVLERRECAAIIAAIINLGRSLDIVTLAEGVETERQFEALRAAGLTQAQGYLFGRPVPVGQIRFEADEAAQALSG